MVTTNTEKPEITDEEKADYLETESVIESLVEARANCSVLIEQVAEQFFERYPHLRELVIKLNPLDSHEFPSNKVENK